MWLPEATNQPFFGMAAATALVEAQSRYRDTVRAQRNRSAEPTALPASCALLYDLPQAGIVSPILRKNFQTSLKILFDLFLALDFEAQ